MSDSRDVALGLAVVGADLGVSAARVAVASASLARRVPLVDAVAHRVAADLAHQGALARARLDVRTQKALERALMKLGLERPPQP